MNMDGNNMNMPRIDGANLGGSTKILNFEEFCTAQSGGMGVPTMGTQEPTLAPEMELPRATTELEGDDMTVLDTTDDAGEAEETPATDEPEGGEKTETHVVD